LGHEGSVLYQFEKKGIVTVLKDGKSLDDIFLVAADSGAEDVEEVGDEVLVYTKPEDLAKARDALQAQDLNISGAEFSWKPVALSPITDKNEAEKALSFLDRLESLEDVQKVYANFDIPDDVTLDL
jgi:transcriptional/translational regulatory protein YebC/TACO1